MVAYYRNIVVNGVSCVIYDIVAGVFFFKHKAAYEMRISDWSSDVCSSDLKSVRENVEAVAREKGVDASEIIVCVLDRPRHEKQIGRASCRERVCQYV